MDPSIRARLERLEALIDAAPSPYAWVQLCAALSEWPDHDELELGIELVRAHMHAWPRALRSAPEWWRMAWERGIPEPRLVLAAMFDDPLLPAHGGGSCPVQHHVYFRDRVYYVRFRHDHLSISLDQICDRTIDCDLFGADLECIETQEIGVGGSWSSEETNVMLSLISAAIRRNDLASLEVPKSPAALRASEHYMLGPYPLLVTRLSKTEWSEPFQPCNTRWMEMVRLGEPVPAAVVHHLSSRRPAAIGPMKAPARRVWFPWSPWPEPRPEPGPEPAISKRRCELRLLRRWTVNTIGIEECVFLDDVRVLLRAEDGSRHVVDLRTDSCASADEHDEFTAALERAIAPSRERLPDCVWLDDYEEVVFLDDGRVATLDESSLRIWDPQTGVCQAQLLEKLDGVALATRGTFVVFGDLAGDLWIFEVGPAELVTP